MSASDSSTEEFFDAQDDLTLLTETLHQNSGNGIEIDHFAASADHKITTANEDDSENQYEDESVFSQRSSSSSGSERRSSTSEGGAGNSTAGNVTLRANDQQSDPDDGYNKIKPSKNVDDHEKKTEVSDVESPTISITVTTPSNVTQSRECKPTNASSNTLSQSSGSIDSKETDSRSEASMEQQVKKNTNDGGNQTSKLRSKDNNGSNVKTASTPKVESIRHDSKEGSLKIDEDEMKKPLRYSLSDDGTSPSREERDMTVESALEGARLVKTAETMISKQKKSDDNVGNKQTGISDKEVLQKVMVKNLDTGIEVPLSEAEKQIPSCANPLSAHIMKITSDFPSDDESKDDREEKQDDKVDTEDKAQEKKKGFRHFLGRRNKRKKKGEDGQREEDDESTGMSDHASQPKYKAASHHKGPYDFTNTKLIQDMSGEHQGPIWTMSFSNCGKLLASGGQDAIVRIWVLKICAEYFKEMVPKNSPSDHQGANSTMKKKHSSNQLSQGLLEDGPFYREPLCIFIGHTADILDLSWSRNYFLLSSSMDKSVRLWHISRKECLCCFIHTDFVAAIAFHPLDDRYFLSGSFDGKLRLWNIPKKKVAMWNEIDASAKLITAANFCQKGKYAVIGTYDGRCIFYDTEQLKYHTQIHVRSSRGKNAKGRKICGIMPMPGSNRILVTSNDSRIRLYDLTDFKMSCKYKGCVDLSSQIKASFNQSGEAIICGSEDHFIYVWKTYHEFTKSSSRRDRNDCFESFQGHDAIVTSALFVPVPSMAMQFLNVLELYNGEVIVAADYQGNIKVFANKLDELE